MNSLSTDKIGDLINRFKPLSVEEMPSHVLDGTTFDHPVIDPTWREVRLPRDRTVKVQLSIADANHGKYYYAFLDERDLERYGGSFRVVTKQCDAAKADDKRIPDNYFNKQGVIYRDGLLYCYCSWQFHENMSNRSEERGARTLASFMPGNPQETRDASGKLLGSVHKTGLTSKLVAVADPNAKKGQGGDSSINENQEG